MMARLRRLAPLFLCLMLLSGCVASPPDTLVRTENSAALISASTSALSADTHSATLYFRYDESPYLAAEERILSVDRDESLEKALIQALIDGPLVTSSLLSPLFPQDVEVLAVSRQGDTLFVTFNEALLGRYADEPGDISQEPWKTEFPLRRRLCMDSLTATLTEAGLCTQVQVLVYRENIRSNSMRLHAGYFTRSQDETLLPPLTRNEAALFTPHNAADTLLRAWMTQDFSTLYTLVARENATDPRPGEQESISAFAAGKALTGYTLSSGQVSFDGQRTVLCVDMSLRGSGNDLTFSGYPLHLSREEGLWKISYSSLLSMMNQD